MKNKENKESSEEENLPKFSGYGFGFGLLALIILVFVNIIIGI
ncbi:MAG: hypothetical protein ACFFAN_05060 [Promethearchaeota archaeon]